MDARYTKAIIMLVVGFPVLMAGIVIDKALESDSGTPKQSTITIARLMMAFGAIMVTVGIFFCCTITLNKKEKTRTPRPLPNSIRVEQPQLIIPLQPQVPPPPKHSQVPPHPKHSTPKRKAAQSSSGIRLLSYSPVSNNHNATNNVETALSVTPVNKSSSALTHSINTPSSNRDTGQFSSTSSSTHDIVQYPSTSGIQVTRKHPNSSESQNLGHHPKKTSATHRISQYRSTSVTEIISQHSSTTSTQNISLHSTSSGAQHGIKELSSSSENIVYQVSSADMAKLLMAAKKSMDPKAFHEIARTYQIALLSTPGRQAPDPSSGTISKSSSVERMSKSSSVDRMSKSSSSSRKHTSKKAGKDAAVSIVISDAPSAPPYQSSPEVEPPPYSP